MFIVNILYKLNVIALTLALLVQYSFHMKSIRTAKLLIKDYKSENRFKINILTIALIFSIFSLSKANTNLSFYLNMLSIIALYILCKLITSEMVYIRNDIFKYLEEKEQLK